MANILGFTLLSDPIITLLLSILLGLPSLSNCSASATYFSLSSSIVIPLTSSFLGFSITNVIESTPFLNLPVA